jgi:hypothetical protein
MIKLQYDIERLLHEQYSSADMVQEKPFCLRVGEYEIVFPPATWLRITDLLKDIYKHLGKWAEFYDSLDFLSHLEIKDEAKLAALISKARIFTASKSSRRLYADLARLIGKWGLAYKRTDRGFKQIRLSKKIMQLVTPEQLIIGLQALIIWNEELPKKKILEALRDFRGAMSTGWGRSSTSSGAQVIQLPSWKDLHANSSGSS